MEKAVIFDLDGTLWDATPHVYKIWNNVFERHPETPLRVNAEDVEQCMGKTMDEIGEKLMPLLDNEFRSMVMDEIGEEEVVFLRKHGGFLYDGVTETLRKLKDTYDLFIVSNCQDGYVEAFLTAHRFTDLFKDFEMSGRTGRNKGENIRLVMERNRITEAVYVGDTAGDQGGALGAGIPFIHASYGFGAVTGADAVISGITELPAVLEDIFNR